jgi:hypothetical protein
MFPSASELALYIQIATGAAVVLGFFFTYLSFNRTRKLEQIQLVEKIKDSLTDLDRELREIEDGDKEALSFWDSRRLNTWEWFSFLVNEKQITDKNLKRYFRGALVNDFEEIFLEFAPEEARNDPTVYPEYKKLYAKLTEGS